MRGLDIGHLLPPPRKPAAPAPATAPALPPTHAMARGTAGQALMLLPGQWHFGRQVPQLRTLLGSCVAITLWHPKLKVGGMCHYLLPGRKRANQEPLEGRFGDEALELMLGPLRRQGAPTQEYEAHLYGGADTMPEHVGAKLNIGERNIEAGWSLIDKHGFMLQGVDVGDNVPRTVQLDIKTGEVQVRRGQPTKKS